MKITTVIILMLFAVLTLTVLSGGSYGDYIYTDATESSDTIYFGCSVHDDGTLKLLIARKTGEDDVALIYETMDTGELTIHGNGGNDRITVASTETWEGHYFEDISCLRYRTIVLYGDDGDDDITGTYVSDIIYGGNGDDHLKGMGGADYIYGNLGNDFIEGGSQDDHLFGHNGNDYIIGDNGEDQIYGGPDDDYLWGGAGIDLIQGEQGRNFLSGGRDNDALGGGDDDDILCGGTGTDYIYGGEGSDTFWGRHAATPEALWDPVPGTTNGPETDWNDSPAAVEVEIFQIKDPYQEWANISYHPPNTNGIYNTHLTTSNPQLLINDREGGAVILPDRRGAIPLHTTHKQHGNTCGPTALNMVMEYLGLADHNLKVYFPRDLDTGCLPVGRTEWPDGNAVDVGYFLSMEHIMCEWFHLKRAEDPEWVYDVPNFMSADGKLNTADGTRDGEYVDIKYDIGNVDYDPVSGRTTGKLQRWIEKGPGEGGQLLLEVANKFSRRIQDARGVKTSITATVRDFDHLDHLKEVIKGFIDHNIPLLVGVENDGHFNTLIGYWDSQEGFYVYLADPLDGYSRWFYNKPMRWRKFLLTADAVLGASNFFTSIVLYGHQGAPWAQAIDSHHTRKTLCGYLYDDPRFCPCR